MRQQIRVKTVGLAQGAGPAAVPVKLTTTDMSRVDIEAWFSNSGESNVYIFAGTLTLAECEALVKPAGKATFEIPCLACISGTAPVKFPMPDNTTGLTVYFEGTNEAGETQSVTIKTGEIPEVQ